MSGLDALFEGKLPPPAAVGDPVEKILTPSLVVDLDAFETNLAAMAAFGKAKQVALWPHAKTHKCPEIARRQIALGAAGICAQKPSEAVPFVLAGVESVLVSNQVVDDARIELLCSLAERADVSACVDNPDNVANLSRIASRRGVELSLLVEIDVGMDRCGVDPGEPAVTLARQVADAPNLSFAGIQAYHGGAQTKPLAQRREMIAEAAASARMTRDALEAAGLPCPRVAGAGTGSFFFEAASGVYTELQPGSYALMDRAYAEAEPSDDAEVPRFQRVLTVLSTVVSAPRPNRAVCDAGLKSITFELGNPVAVDEGVTYAGPSDEHGKLELDDGVQVAVGDLVHLVPGHIDPCVNLHDWLVCVRDGKVQELWPVSARGHCF